MKLLQHQMTILFVAGLTLLASSLMYAQEVIEVQNPGFEDGRNAPTHKEVMKDNKWTMQRVHGPQPSHWRMRVWTGNVRAALDSNVKQSGKRSFRIESLGDETTGGGSIYQQVDHNLRAGQLYTLVFHVKKTPLAEVGVAIWSDGGAHFHTQANWDFNANFTQWQKIQFTFEATKTSTKGFWIVFKLKGDRGERAWFDEVSMHQGVNNHDTKFGSENKAVELPSDLKDANYGFFEIVNFETILPTHHPSQLDRTLTMRIDACADEFTAATFGVYALRDVQSMTIYPSRLTSETGEIAAENVDLRVVKCWKQRRPRWTSQPPPTVVLPEYLTPELLLKDDKWDADNRPRGFAPDIRLTGPVATRIAANTVKQIWMTIQIPPDTPPGRYTGHVTIETSEDDSTSQVDLIANVLPFDLVKPNKIYGAYVNKGYVFGRNPQQYSETRYEAKLRDLRDHGLNALPIMDGLDREQIGDEWVLRWDNVRTALTYNKAYGLDHFQPFLGFMWAMLDQTHPLYKGKFNPTTNELLQWYVKELNTSLENEKLNPVTYYLIDEPHIYDDGTAWSQALGRLFHEAGGQTTTAVTFNAWHDVGDAIDIPILGIGLEARRYLQSIATGKTKRTSEHPILCYWQFWEEYPLFNRQQFGYFLWASGLDGVIPYGYQHFGGSGDPYDDFDHTNKDIFVAYPSKHGPVATLQWEACREGINDLRYLSTLIQAVDAAKKTASKREALTSAERFLAALNERIQLLPQVPVQDPINPQEYVLLRCEIIELILALIAEKEMSNG